jgi:hypothetical protein
MHVAHCGGFGVRLILADLFGREFWERVKETGVDGFGPGGDDGGEHGRVVESNAIAEMRKCDGIGCFWLEQVDRMADWCGKGKANVVEWLMWSVAGARDDWRFCSVNANIRVVKHFDGAVSEDSCAIMVADFADR